MNHNINILQMVQIANPIYDVVFKYLMKDKKVSKLLLSAITGKEIVDLDFRPTEYELPIGESLIVVRMDFSARVKEANGEEHLILIELQKAKTATDFMRFRRYLGEQYANENNVYSRTENEKYAQKPLPIISIYFLGENLEHCQAPIVHVKRQCLNGTTGKKLTQKEEFIESLTHDSYIIQIRYLVGKRRSELEQLLSIFDQTNKSADAHFLTINEQEVPQPYRPLIRRLQKALADVKVKRTMTAEDEIIEEIKSYQRMIEKRDQALKERDQALEEKDKVIRKAIAQMSQAGMSIAQIAKTLSVSEEEIKRLT